MNVGEIVDKFTGHMIIGGAGSEVDYFRHGIDQLESWVEHWQMEFVPDWCEVMHLEG